VSPGGLIVALMISDLLLYCSLMFIATLAGGLVTLIRPWSDEWLHLFLSFGAGIFLGAVFMHLLPETMGEGWGHWSGLYILAGYLLIFFVERILLYREGGKDGHGHLVVSLTALIGLSVHSVMEGFGLAIVMPDKELAAVLFTSILAHKIPAAFSLASLMILAKQTRGKTVLGLLLFAATAPLGALVLGPMLDYEQAASLRPFTGLVTGSFLYVATADLLPEVFHSRERRWINLLLMIVGVALMSLFCPGDGHH